MFYILPNLASIPTTACWSAPFMISLTDAEVGKQRVWTRILLSPKKEQKNNYIFISSNYFFLEINFLPFEEVYNKAAWKVTSRESLKSSSIET